MKVLVGTRKGLFTLADNGGSLSVDHVDFLGVPVNLSCVDRRDGALYAALDHGHFGPKLHRSDDGGASWTELNAPAYPPKPEGFVDVCPMRQTERPWSTQLIWSMSAGHPDRPGQVWAGTIPGGLFRSDDRGESWELVRSLWDRPERLEWMGGGFDLPGIHSVEVHPHNPDEVVISVSCGGAWRTIDGGKTWDVTNGMRNAYMPPDLAYSPVAQDPHRTVRCAAVPDVLWTQHHNGIFRSTDAGENWTEFEDVPPSTFGFAVAVHPHDPDTAWFVPGVADELRIPVDGRLVITRTRDGGQSWENIGNGLPSEHCYDLIYRHGLDVDATGERLVMGSTTGSVWASNDAGDSWTNVTSTLPPVYSVMIVD
ncbi:MAG: WD40/YVTN/BNR-like repeat-containing protein [Acidimicrobiia bacterium]